MPKKTAKEPQNWKRIWQMIRPYRGWMIASMVLAAFTVAFTLYIPILVGNAIDAMVEAGKVSFAIITPILWKIAILAILTALFQWIMQTMHNKIRAVFVKETNGRSVRHKTAKPVLTSRQPAYVLQWKPPAVRRIQQRNKSVAMHSARCLRYKNKMKNNLLLSERNVKSR